MKRRDFLKGAAGGLALLTFEGKVVDARTVEALPPEALGILYDSTLCVGCNACMAACKKANSMEPESTDSLPIYDNPQDLYRLRHRSFSPLPHELSCCKAACVLQWVSR